MKLAVAALAATLIPGAAMAQDLPRVVMFSGPGAAVFVPQSVTGPRDKLMIELMMVFPQPVDDGDVHLNPWVVDCTTMSASPRNGRAFMGTKFVRNTVLEGEDSGGEGFHRAIADYACNGKRFSTDARVVKTFGEAIDYGRQLSAN